MATNHDRVLYSSSLVAIGAFDCPVSAPNFTNTGPIPNYLLAFPQTAVLIRHLDKPGKIVADPNIVTLYNKGQEYERFALSAYGDRCDWLSPCPAVVAEALAESGTRVRGDPERLFEVASSMSPPLAYARFRRLTTNLRSRARPDPVAVEETAMEVLRDVLAGVSARQREAPAAMRSTTRARYTRLVRKTQKLMATRYREPLTLAALAREVNASAYHLCRVFRSLTGTTVHRYLTQLRLRNALRSLTSTGVDLATLSVEAGFSDHSHFSRYFRESFQVTPSGFRSALRQREAPPRRG